jgi:hypothetical protein
MARFVEVTVESGTVRLLNTDQIAEISERESDRTAILHMVSGTVHPTKMPYADMKRTLAAVAK